VIFRLGEYQMIVKRAPGCLILIIFMAMFGLSPAVLAVDGVTASPAFSVSDLSAHPQNGWLTNGGNLSNQRYSPLTRINRENVTRLKAVWRASLNGSGLGPQYSGQAQPLIYEGVLYIVTGQDDVFAIDIASGELIWNYQAQVAPEDVVVCCGWVSRGLGMGDGRIYVGQLNAKLVALNQKTGEVVWQFTQAGTVHFACLHPGHYEAGMKGAVAVGSKP